LVYVVALQRHGMLSIYKNSYLNSVIEYPIVDIDQRIQYVLLSAIVTIGFVCFATRHRVKKRLLIDFMLVLELPVT
jgi:hypothetical protein